MEAGLRSSLLGITVRDLSADRLEALGVEAGAEVVAVSGIAEEAGMRVGDVVLRMRGKVIADAQTLQEVAESAEPGDVVPVLVLRQQAEQCTPQLHYAARARRRLRHISSPKPCPGQ